MKYVEKILETYGLPVQKIEQMYADLYTDNKHVPEDVPFDVIADEFIKVLKDDLVSKVEMSRAGLVATYNRWLNLSGVKLDLYQKRNWRYPNMRPKKERHQTLRPDQMPGELLKQKIKELENMMDFNVRLIDEMMREYKAELERLNS